METFPPFRYFDDQLFKKYKLKKEWDKIKKNNKAKTD